MSFFTFNIDDETGQRRWLVSDRFWIYCEFHGKGRKAAPQTPLSSSKHMFQIDTEAGTGVVTIPLTILTLVCWAYGQRKAEKGGNSRQESWKSEGP